MNKVIVSSLLVASLVSNGAYAADPHDIIGGLLGLGILHRIAHSDDGHKEHRHNEDERVWVCDSDRYNSECKPARPYYEGDIDDAYRKHYPCGRQYAGYRGCRRIVEDNRTIIIIER